MKIVTSDNPPYFLDLDAASGSSLVEALDPDGNVIEGFASQDCTLTAFATGCNGATTRTAS